MRESGIQRPKRLTDALDGLTELADSGDVDAQYILGRWLSECQRIHSRTSHERTLPENLEFCDGVSADRRAEGGNWLELAASSGSLLALHSQVTAAVTANERGSQVNERIFQLNEKMWLDHGHMGALSALAIFWSKGWVPGGEPDYVRAYAYQFVNLKVSEAIFASSRHPSSHRSLHAIGDSLSSLASHLTPQQTLEAEALGRRLLRENPKCCSSFAFGWTR